MWNIFRIILVNIGEFFEDILPSWWDRPWNSPSQKRTWRWLVAPWRWTTCVLFAIYPFIIILNSVRWTKAEEPVQSNILKWYKINQKKLWNKGMIYYYLHIYNIIRFQPGNCFHLLINLLYSYLRIAARFLNLYFDTNINFSTIF